LAACVIPQNICGYAKNEGLAYLQIILALAGETNENLLRHIFGFGMTRHPAAKVREQCWSILTANPFKFGWGSLCHALSLPTYSLP
jgi:hypothetical protein